MDKYEIAHILREIGLLIEFTDPLPEKSFSYKRAARTIESVKDLEYLIKEGHLETLPGIGKKISWIIINLSEQGQSEYYEELKTKVPSSLLELLNIPGLNPKKIRTLHEKLNIKDINDLKLAIQNDSLKALKLLPPYAIRKLSKNIESIEVKGYSMLYPKALNVAIAIKEYLVKNNVVDRCEISSSLRRKCEIIRELYFVAETKTPKNAIETFNSHPSVKEIIELDAVRSVVQLKYGLKATLVAASEDFEWNLFASTGNEEHVKKILRMAKNKKSLILLKTPNEAALYSAFNLDYIPPELRENQGEIEAAKKRNLPNLIERADIKGAFHCHTMDSDGRDQLEELVAAARHLGWKYLGISDHSKSSYQANGMSEETLLKQIERIRKLNSLIENFELLSGVECDIMKDGTLDFSNELLSQLDFVIVSVHRYFNMEKKEMTKRIIKAIENPYATIVGHLTGRLLRSREPYEVDIKKVIDACIANGKIMELNCTPDRLDLDWRYWKKAKEKGLLCCINPDAHSIYDLGYIEYGINMARKGWLEKKDVINTMALNEIKVFLNNLKPK